MPAKIETPNAAISGVMEKFRLDIMAGNFTISGHMNERMVTRGIAFKEIMEAVRLGVLSKGYVIPDYIGGKYVHNDLTVIVYAPFGDYSAKPCIVTAYKPDDYEELRNPLDDLVYKEYMGGSKGGVEDLTIEELEAVLVKKKFKQAEEETRKKELKRKELMGKRGALETRINELNGELESIKRLLEDL